MSDTPNSLHTVTCQCLTNRHQETRRLIQRVHFCDWINRWHVPAVSMSKQQVSTACPAFWKRYFGNRFKDFIDCAYQSDMVIRSYLLKENMRWKWALKRDISLNVHCYWSESLSFQFLMKRYRCAQRVRTITFLCASCPFSTDGMTQLE